jgi:hypothetical protein
MAYNQTAADYYFIDQCQSMSFSLSDLHAPSALEIRRKFLGIPVLAEICLRFWKRLILSDDECCGADTIASGMG